MIMHYKFISSCTSGDFEVVTEFEIAEPNLRSQNRI
jgi:hypothetical protein